MLQQLNGQHIKANRRSQHTKCGNKDVFKRATNRQRSHKHQGDNMLQQSDINWTIIINFTIQTYLKDFTICVIWHPRIEFNLNLNENENSYTIINIDMESLRQSFDMDMVDFEKNRVKLNKNGVIYNDLTQKLLMSIETSHCEGFLAFDEDILPFIESFLNASQYSVWRSKRNRFIFGISNRTQEKILQEHTFLEDQPNILVITSNPSSPPHQFDLKTNKFQGPKRERQNSLQLLDRFFGNNETFLYNVSLFPDKVHNLKGREVVVTGFDYKPYMVINYVAVDNNSYDLAFGSAPGGSVQIDGTEARVIMTFCEIYNCSVLIDSSEADDWGEVYSNLSGDGSLGMVAKGLAEIAVAAMYSWDIDYIYLDMSMYLVRSGVTCLVPAPKRLASWLLPLEPFQFTLWIAVLAYLIVETISLCLTHAFESRHISGGRSSWSQSLRFGGVTTLKVFLSQSSNGNVTSWTVRILLFTCFLNDIIITSIYGGGLSSILTVPSYEDAADTIDRMFSRKLKWAANSEAWVSTIRNTDDYRMNGIMKNFYHYPDDKLKSLADTQRDFGFAVERLPFGHFAVGDFLTPEIIAHLKIMHEDLYFQYTVAFVSRCWPLLAQFDDLIYWWHSAGLDRYWEWRVVADNMNLQKQKQVEATMYSYLEDIGPVKLGMSNFVGILLIWVLGIAVASVVFLYEVIGKYLKQRKKNLLLRKKVIYKFIRKRIHQ